MVFLRHRVKVTRWCQLKVLDRHSTCMANLIPQLYSKVTGKFTNCEQMYRQTNRHANNGDTYNNVLSIIRYPRGVDGGHKNSSKSRARQMARGTYWRHFPHWAVCKSKITFHDERRSHVKKLSHVNDQGRCWYKRAIKYTINLLQENTITSWMNSISWQNQREIVNGREHSCNLLRSVCYICRESRNKQFYEAGL